MDLQKIVDSMNGNWQRQRSETQMTLFELIVKLRELGDKEVDAIEAPHSYRGYYSDLAFEREKGKMKASEALEIVSGCLGETYTGYKGGDYTMTKITPLWIANNGQTGVKIMGIKDDGSFETMEDDY